MPVGEIGKNLQALLGCDALSKRLKEQFSGLKRAIENSDSPRIKMGSEHPFNPVVSLSGDKEAEDPNSVLPYSFAHVDYVFTPYQYQLQIQSTANKDAQSTQGRNSRYPYRRPPPVLESQSFSQSESSPDYQSYPRRNNYSNYPVRGRGGYPSSPGGRQYYRNQPHMPGQPPQMFPMEFHMPIPPQYPNNVFPTMPVFPPTSNATSWRPNSIHPWCTLLPPSNAQ